MMSHRAASGSRVAHLGALQAAGTLPRERDLAMVENGTRGGRADTEVRGRGELDRVAAVEAGGMGQACQSRIYVLGGARDVKAGS